MNNSERKNSCPASETDARFPSGLWTGFYVQWGQRGQQDLTLSFKNGQISGCGSDTAGEFEIEGQYDPSTGQCGLTKSYADSHDVEYEGKADPTGISGNWLLYHQADPLGIPRDRGTFHIWPVPRSGAAGNHADQHLSTPHTCDCQP
jgi:hypothetical protein